MNNNAGNHLCDFCLDSNFTGGKEFETRDDRVKKWFACPCCAGCIERKDFLGLMLRTTATLEKRLPVLNNRQTDQIISALTETFELFFARVVK